MDVWSYRLSVFLVMLSTSAYCQSREVFSNGGLEMGSEGWTMDGTLLTGAKDAHSGLACFFGEVTAPQQARHIKRVIHLDAKNLYCLAFWVRGTNETKAVLWLQKGAVRRNAGLVKVLPRQWRRFVMPFTVPESGEWTLDLVAPSSFGAPAGKAWVDDLSLTETQLPPLVDITSDARFNERPSLAVGGDGAAYCAWLSFADGKDTIRLARLSGVAEQKPDIAPPVEVPLPDCEGVSGISLAPAKSGAWLAASCDVGGAWDIYLWPVAAEGAGQPLRVTQDPATDINPSLATFSGRTLIAWETNRSGPRQILVADVADGKSAQPCQVSSSGTWNYHPSLAGDHSGRACCVWESFRDSNYDIFAAEFDGRTWSAERRLTSDPRIELRPSVTFGKDGPWMAWETMTFGGYRTTAAREQRVVAARIDRDGLRAPQSVFSVFSNFTQHPTIGCDDAGRVWVAVRQARERQGWDVVVRAFCGADWSPQRQLTSKTGRAQLCPMAIAAGRLLVAIQHDTVGMKYNSVKDSTSENSNIALCCLDLAECPPCRAALLPVLSLPRPDFDMPSLRAQYGEDSPKRSIQYDGQELRLLWGQFHEHSEISVCNRNGDLPPEDHYTYNRDIQKMDFAALTDHGYNLSPAVWNYLSKIVRTQNDPGIFVSFLGEEWTSTFEEYSKEHPYGFYGHRNLIFADARFPRWFNAQDRSTPSQVWDELRRMKANFINIPHQIADTGNVPTDWSYTDDVAQPVAEIFQARQSYEYRGCPRQAKNVVDTPGYFLQEVWAKGIIIGVIASPDHGGGMGKAAVYAPAQTREAILDACRARHTYGTTAAKILLDVRVNGRLMGEKIKSDRGPVRVHVETTAPGEIERVEVCRSNQFVYTKEPASTQCRFDFEDPNPLPGESYYYVRVLQKDQEIAWSSPVWITH